MEWGGRRHEQIPGMPSRPGPRAGASSAHLLREEVLTGGTWTRLRDVTSEHSFSNPQLLLTVLRGLQPSGCFLPARGPQEMSPGPGHCSAALSQAGHCPKLLWSAPDCGDLGKESGETLVSEKGPEPALHPRVARGQNEAPGPGERAGPGFESLCSCVHSRVPGGPGGL